MPYIIANGASRQRSYLRRSFLSSAMLNDFWLWEAVSVFVWFFSLSIQKFTSVATYSPGEEREGPFPGLSPIFTVSKIYLKRIHLATQHSLMRFCSPPMHKFPTKRLLKSCRPLPPVRCPGQYATANAGRPVHAESLARTATRLQSYHGCIMR